jgi:hypothetical protein
MVVHLGAARDASRHGLWMIRRNQALAAQVQEFLGVVNTCEREHEAAFLAIDRLNAALENLDRKHTDG